MNLEVTTTEDLKKIKKSTLIAGRKFGNTTT